MRSASFVNWKLLTLGVVAATVLGTPHAGRAQAVLGQARAVQATVSTVLSSTSIALADTGTLSDLTDARSAAQGSGLVSTVFRGGILHAATVGGDGQVTSEASAADVAVDVAGNAITADFVMSRARAIEWTGTTGAVEVSGLTVNGMPVAVSGEVNQTVPILGGQVVINERRASGSVVTVNALRIVVDGAADIVIASATAGL